MTLIIKWNDRFSKSKGTIELAVEHDKKFYDKFFYANTPFTCKENADKLARYIMWSDKHGFIPSRAWRLSSLNHDNRSGFSFSYGLPFFDHTTYWRKKGVNKPLFCLTEPYGHESPEKYSEQLEDLYEKFNIKNKWFQPSSSSLHNESTWMVFLWNPERFEFKDEYAK